MDVPDVPLTALVVVVGAGVIGAFIFYRRRRPKDTTAE